MHDELSDSAFVCLSVASVRSINERCLWCCHEKKWCSRLSRVKGEQISSIIFDQTVDFHVYYCTKSSRLISVATWNSCVLDDSWFMNGILKRHELWCHSVAIPSFAIFLSCALLLWQTEQKNETFRYETRFLFRIESLSLCHFMV